MAYLQFLKGMLNPQEWWVLVSVSLRRVQMSSDCDFAPADCFQDVASVQVPEKTSWRLRLRFCCRVPQL